MARQFQNHNSNFDWLYRVQNKMDFGETKNIGTHLRISFQRIQEIKIS